MKKLLLAWVLGLGLALGLVAAPAVAVPVLEFTSIEQALDYSPVVASAESPDLPAQVQALPRPVVVQVEAPKAPVTIPLNQWIADAQAAASVFLLAVLTRLLMVLPAPVVWLVRTYGVQRIVEQAIGAGINAIPGAVRHAPLTVDVGNRVIAAALQWAVNELPGFVVKALGGEEGLRAKIFAALHLDADASAAALGVKLRD